MTEQSIALFKREGRSDKVFNVQLKKEGESFRVFSQNGRRGSTLTNREVTTSALPYEAAKKAYDAKINSKLKDGYTTDESGSSYAGTDDAGRVSGLSPQLLNPIEDKDVQSYIDDDEYVAQEKMDGERLMTSVSSESVVGSNKRGLIVGLATTVFDGLQAIGRDIVLDGEVVGSDYYLFDLLSVNGIPYTDISFIERHNTLNNFSFVTGTYLHIVPIARTRAEKIALIERVRAENGEGVVFKKSNAPYVAGRPNSGGDQLKYKFVASCSAIVKSIKDGKRSAGLVLLDNGNEKDIGFVTIPVNKEIPEIGDIVEVQYLYAYQEGSLIQPVFKDKRFDVTRDECVINQLKYKRELIAA